MRAELDAYRPHAAVPAAAGFIDDLTNWSNTPHKLVKHA
jgi:hypothetical protein